MAHHPDPFRHVWWVLTPLALYFGVFALRHAVLADAAHLPPGFTEQPWMYRIHMALGGAALLIGPFQFWPALRKPPEVCLHRTLGALYVVACLGSAATALPLTFALTTFGVATQIGFTLLAVLWFAVTSLALQRVLAGRIVAHRAFMVRSFALAFAAVTLRLLLWVIPAQDLLSYADTYRVSAWACWVPNLVVAECWLRRTSRRVVGFG